MVIIRMNRVGSKKRPKYRITVADSRYWLGGRFLEIIGNYNPHPRGTEQKLVIDLDKAKAWMAQGAQPTERVATLIREASGAKKGADFKPARVPKKPKHVHVPPPAKA